MSGAVKSDFRTYIGQYTSTKENFEYGYPHSNALLQSRLKLECCIKPHVIQRKDVINDIKLFPTVYRRIYCGNFFTLSNQTSHYKSKCIRMTVYMITAQLNESTLQNAYLEHFQLPKYCRNSECNRM